MENNIEVYVKGDVHIPERFWKYALITSKEEGVDIKKYIDIGFYFSQKDTDLYKSLTNIERSKIQFSYINWVKQI